MHQNGFDGNIISNRHINTCDTENGAVLMSAVGKLVLSHIERFLFRLGNNDCFAAVLMFVVIRRPARLGTGSIDERNLELVWRLD
jgi:hypothetical protein